jgi:hypothetical protein
VYKSRDRGCWGPEANRGRGTDSTKNGQEELDKDLHGDFHIEEFDIEF